jgi:hypothetical protein
VTLQAMTLVEKIAEVIAEAKKQSFEKPVLTSFMGFRGDSNPLKILKENDIPKSLSRGRCIYFKKYARLLSYS